MMTLRSNIRDLHNHLARDLLLEVDVEILHIRRLDVTVETEGIALIRASCRRRVYRTTRNNGPAHGAGRENCCRSNVVIRRPRIKERRIRQVAENHVLREGVKEDAVS